MTPRRPDGQIDRGPDQSTRAAADLNQVQGLMGRQAAEGLCDLPSMLANQIVQVEGEGNAGRTAPVHQHLVKIREDPRMRNLAMRIAGDHDLAGDALQRAYFAVAQRKNLDEIENLWAYFRRVLIHEMYRERHQLGAALVDDFERVAEARQAVMGCGAASPPRVEAVVCLSLQAQSWLERLAEHRGALLAQVPARSADPVRYRAVIYSAAEQVLRDGINAEPSEADANPALQAAYPKYFDQPGASADTCYQRFCRARTDVRKLLQGVVRRDELS